MALEISIKFYRTAQIKSFPMLDAVLFQRYNKYINWD